MILVLWATPRSTSTAFEWMMRQRGDFDCLHEPWNELYYYGEDRRSRRDAHVEARPGHSYDAIWAEILDRAARADGSGVFVKDFVYSVEHHLDEVKLAAMTHSFLVRDPRRVIQGLARHWHIRGGGLRVSPSALRPDRGTRRHTAGGNRV